MTRELTWELATGKPPVEGMRLDMVMAYYHNDEEVGFGVGLDGRSPDVDLEAIVHQAFDAYKQAWDLADDERRQQILHGYAEQVVRAASRPRAERERSAEASLILVMNVIWLSSHGLMTNDEYNGTQFFWASGAPLPPREPEDFHITNPDWSEKKC